MGSIYRSATLLFLSVSLIACNSLAVKQSAYPYIPNTAYKLKSNQAVVILGDTTEYRWIEMTARSKQYDMQKVSEDVVAVPVELGSVFEINQLKEVTFNNYSYRYVKFKKPVKLAINKPGIYYYGTLRSAYSAAKKSIVLGYVPDNSKKFLAAARKKYTSIFKQLSPVNF